MPGYDSVSFDPPAPVARVALRDPATGASSGDLLAVLDTGADVTLLPQSVVTGLGVSTESGTSYELASFDGNVSLARSVELDLLFLGKTLRGRFLVYDQDYGILGRDVLNLVSLLMDGPRQTWTGRFGSTKI